ncbi:hypothetical protein ACMAY8_03445 [Rhodobacteraceae bacterium nBUS_22]
MKLRIETIERRSGPSFGGRWKADMFVVNGKYLASTIIEHNIGNWKFDFEKGEKAEVVINRNNWIARRQ